MQQQKNKKMWDEAGKKAARIGKAKHKKDAKGKTPDVWLALF